MKIRKRKITNHFKKPNYVGKYRHIHGVLRDSNGYMVFSEKTNSGIVYKLTSITDLSIKPNNEGKREFNKKWVSELQKNVVNENYVGDLFMYDIHLPNQLLIPIAEFTINKNNTQYYRLNKDGFPYQPYCKDSKRKYQNSQGNKLRTSEQFVESAIGSRSRGLLTALIEKNERIDFDYLFNLFSNKCFNCSRCIERKNRSSYEIDHMMPASGYWPLNKQNTTLLCFDCNQSKTNKHPISFYGYDKFIKLCNLTEFDFNKVIDGYLLNDDILKYFEEYFDDTILKWQSLNRNKKSYKKYILKETKRINSLDIYNKHKLLIEKLKTYAKTI
jgi:5-methylcytosine-specific restriction endonuclease McrA